MKKSLITLTLVKFSILFLFSYFLVNLLVPGKVQAYTQQDCINIGTNCAIKCGNVANANNIGALQACAQNCANEVMAYCGNIINAQPTPIPKLEPAPGFQPLLEKSETQLEIERKNKQLEQELEQSNQELSQKVQEQYQKDRAAGLIKGEETHYGTVEILRDGKITSLDSYIKANAGDIIKTGKDGFIEYDLNNSKTKHGPDTLGVILGLDNSKKKVITPLDWDKDPNYRPELNHWEFWKNTTIDLVDFIDKNRPNYLKSCAVADAYGCSWGTAEFVYGGVGWFNEKMEKDFKKNIVVTPTVAMVPVGTEFSVAVDKDGATTLTTLDGEVVVMDLTSRKSAIVGAYQTITIPKTANGLTEAELQQSIAKTDPSSIDRWWEKNTQEQIDAEFRYFIIGSLAILIVVTILVMILKKIIKNSKRGK